ncbi:MAG: prenyltransferase/squalene oxidase repeat-containing protein, partial [Planctomycetota bacterium]
CLQSAEGNAVERPTGGAGGRYGGRTGGRGNPRNAPVADAIGSGFTRLTSQQRADGSFAASDDRADMEATALWMLALLGDGRTLEAGPAANVLQRGVGWILSRQHPDGALVDPAPGSIGQHALATYALVEAAGLSTKGALVHGGAQAGLDWLFAQRQPDGGWNNGLQGVASDPMSTAKSIAAVASAEFFHFAVQTKSSQLAGWFDDVVVTEPAPTAAALFTRFFAGQDPKVVPAMNTMAARLVGTADPNDPWGAYWTTYALFQMGGRPWTTWQKKLDPAIVKTQIREGDLEGFWEPAGGCSRLTTTALRVLTLEAYYRYTRLIR